MYQTILVQVPLAVRADEHASKADDLPPPQRRLHPSYPKLRASSSHRFASAKIIKQAKVLAIREYKAAQAKAATVHSALLRYNNWFSAYVLKTIYVLV